MRRVVSFGIALLFVLALVLFAVTNRQLVFLSFPGVDIEVGVPAYGLLLGGMLLGILLAGLASLAPRVRRALELRRARRRAERAEARLAERENAEPQPGAALLAAIDRAQDTERHSP